MKITMIVERTRTGYSAYAEKHPIYSTGKSWPQLKINLLQACQLYFDSKKIKIGEDDIRIQLDLPQFFEFYKVINAKALAERIGMHQSLLAQYVRGIKKPSAQQTERIFQGIRSVGRELSRLEIRLRD
ncbi:MAG: helix-turn-helix domain-containing protein [Bacteroidota bacterium]|jgi:hypothetical protein